MNSTRTTMRNLIIQEIQVLLRTCPVTYYLPPWDHLSNRELLQLYSDILIDTITEEYD